MYLSRFPNLASAAAVLYRNKDVMRKSFSAFAYPFCAQVNNAITYILVY